MVSAQNWRDRFLGALVGAAVGDALGAALELWPKERVAGHPFGTEWIDDLLPYHARPVNPLGVWVENPPLGTPTDDTRLNQVFAEAAAKYGQLLNDKLLAAEYVDRYLNRARYYDPAYDELATGQFSLLFAIACGVLELECPLLPGVPPAVLRAGNHGRDRPSLFGLYATRAAGLLHPGDPEAAYRHAYELDFLDIGYARDAFALLAAVTAACFQPGATMRGAVEQALALDPYRFATGKVGYLPTPWQPGRGFLGPWAERTMTERIGRFLRHADEAADDRDLVLRLSREVTDLPRFDAIDALAFPLACCYRADGDARRAMLMAVNDRYLNPDGSFRGFRDIDIMASVAGTLCGALNGVAALPAEWVEPTLSATRQVYGFDVEVAALTMYDRVVLRDS
jgi:ADP-ribosylglycohydrolase